MEKIFVNKNLLEEALNHSNERIKYEYNRFNFTSEQRKTMILIGTIGQLAFNNFLDTQNIEYSFEYQAGNFDEYDFVIKKHIIEIKTSGYAQSFNTLNLLYSEDQLKRGLNKCYSYCVQIFINGYIRQTKKLDLNLCNQAIIAGYIDFSEIKSFKQERKYFGDDYKVPLNKLKDIRFLINGLKNDE